MKEQPTKFIKYTIPIFITIALSILGYIWLNGIPIRGIPETDAIAYVEVCDQQLAPEAKKIIEREEIEKVRHAVQLMFTRPGKANQDEPIIDLVFHQKNGTTYTIQASEKTVWVNGKPHRLRGDNGSVFIKVIEAMFFYEELVEPQP